MPNQQPSTPDPSARLDRMEESLGYTDRTVEQLSAEIADLNKRLQTVTKRLAALEAGLTKLQQPEEEGDPDS
jgi:prefoldin subunit 5